MQTDECTFASVLMVSVAAREFNSYGSRRGNDAVMARGTFANIRLLNKLVGKPGPKTVHVPSRETVSVAMDTQLYVTVYATMYVTMYITVYVIVYGSNYGTVYVTIYVTVYVTMYI